MPASRSAHSTAVTTRSRSAPSRSSRPRARAAPWPSSGRRAGTDVKVKVWGARGSIPAPGPETTRYGGNTSCVQITLDDGNTFVLDAGTGIRGLGLALDGAEHPLHILLTHLHLDHIQGLMFFAPMFNPRSEIV